MKKSAEIGDVAFWEYDKFPFLLCGEITKIYDNGYVKTREFGGMIFNPVFFMEKEKGYELKNKLNELLHEFTKTNRDLQDTFVEKRDKLIQKYQAVDNQKQSPSERILYECVGCHHLYEEKVSSCDCMKNQNNEYREWIANPKG